MFQTGTCIFQSQTCDIWKQTRDFGGESFCRTLNNLYDQAGVSVIYLWPDAFL
jgi:hypothetical protein